MGRKKDDNTANRANQNIRKHKKVLTFNDMEIKVIEHFIEKYKIKNKSKFFRGAIISTILKKMEEDHPTLF